MAWDANRNEVLAKRVGNFARMLQDLRDEGRRIGDVVTYQAAGGADLVDASTVGRDQLVAAIGLINECRSFMEGDAAVPQADRLPVIAPFLIEP